MPLDDVPRVTVVTATYARGRHILPTLRSVMAQDYDDWEYLIVGDCCDDDTGEAVAPFVNDRIRWINLEERAGDQDGPNIRGIAEARGEFVAFLGHDDVWAPHHLSSGGSRFEKGGADMVTAGLVEHNASDLLPSRICGLYDEAEGTDAAWRHFVPSTEWMLACEMPDRTGPWRSGGDQPQPTDDNYLDRVLEGPGRVRSSGQVTAHKLAGVARYFAYLRQVSWEQEEFLESTTTRVAHGTYAQWVEGLIAQAKADNRYMEDTSNRRTGSNHRSHMLIPVAAEGLVYFEVPIIALGQMDPHDVTIEVNGGPVKVTATPKTQDGRWSVSHVLTFEGMLKPDTHSLLLFVQPPETMMMLGPRTRRGIAVGTVQLTPATP